MKKQKIELVTNGKHRGTKLFIDGKQIYFESLNITGSSETDYDIVIGLSNSKVSKEELKGATGNSSRPLGFTHAIGEMMSDSECEDEEFYEDDE